MKKICKKRNNFLSNQHGQALVETVIIVMMLLVFIMAVFQITILMAVQMGLNIAAWMANRAVYTSSNRDNKGFDNSNSALQDAKNVVNEVYSIFFTLGWCDIPWQVELHMYNPGSRDRMNGNSRSIGDNQTLGHDQDIWIIITCKFKIQVPFMKNFLSDGAPFNPTGYRQMFTSYLVRTPSNG